ncbi:hypothetical protein G6514_000794 [Epicoccum nigrum]|nr:hypothetical protein G6514_000794 [Epicoccum nigrum]
MSPLSSTSIDLSTSASSALSSSSTSSSTSISSATIPSPSTTSTPTPTPTPTPSAPQYTNFCLRVTTPTSPVYGVTIRNGNAGQNLILGNPNGLTYPIVFFTLDAAGRLATTAGFLLSPIQTNNQYSNLRPFTQASIDRNPSTFKQEYCTVTQSGELVCAAMGTQYSIFTKVSSNMVLSVANPEAASAVIVPLNLGVFFGDKCVDGSSL